MIISGAQLTILLTILGMGSAGIAALVKMGRIAGRFEHIAEKQAEEIESLKKSVESLTKVVTEVALQNQRQDMLDKRQGRLEEQLDALRKGEGWIMPHEMIEKLLELNEAKARQGQT